MSQNTQHWGERKGKTTFSSFHLALPAKAFMFNRHKRYNNSVPFSLPFLERAFSFLQYKMYTKRTLFTDYNDWHCGVTEK